MMRLWRTLSLQARQLLAASLGLVAFLGLTGYALDHAFVETAQSSQRERLKAYAYAYYEGIDITRSKQVLAPELPPDPRFNRPGSGLYAALIGNDVAWRSPSTLGQQLPFDTPLVMGRQTFEGPLPFRAADGREGAIYRFAQGLVWDSPEVAFTFYIAEDAATIDRQVGVFRRALWVYLGAAAALLMLVQTLVLRWSLRPLRQVVRELTRVQRGGAQRLSGRHPRELAPLTDSINAFIESEREHLDRYRHTLSDLAHSLKTPLAVLRSRLENEATEAELRTEVQAQVQRMSEIVSYQLSRAATSGHQLFAAPIEIEPQAEDIVVSLEKVYASKNVLCEFEIDLTARFHGELGDLQELLGNLLENAFKWARRRVLLSAQPIPGPAGQRPGLLMVVEDDGPGIARADAEHLLRRGVRGDERVQGHGIGLAIVQDIVRAYRGELSVEGSEELGGARFVLRFPPAL